MLQHLHVQTTKRDRESGKLTASVTNLDTSLADMNGDDFPHSFVRIPDVIEEVEVGEERGERVRLMHSSRVASRRTARVSVTELDHDSQPSGIPEDISQSLATSQIPVV